MKFNENQNLLIAVVLSIAVFMGWHYLYEAPQLKTRIEQRKTLAPNIATKYQEEGVISSKRGHINRQQALTESPRITIKTPSLEGSIRLKGGCVDDLKLVKYHETVNPNSANIVLFSPVRSKKPYFAEFGWITNDQSILIPNDETVWQASRQTLTPENHVKLTWDNGQGIIFERTYYIDKDYLFTIKQRIINKSNRSVTLYPYNLITRIGTPETSGYMILHEGSIGYLNNKLREIDYKDLQKDPSQNFKSKGGWLGITDKYWLTALIPNQRNQIDANFRDIITESTNRYQVDYIDKSLTIPPKQEGEAVSHLFAGAKVLSLLDGYEELLGVEHFDLAVDFGWLYFLTKPTFYILSLFYSWLGNFGLAILLLTILLKLALFPFANKSYRSMAKMKALQPQIEHLRGRFKNDKMRMNQEMMELYKREKVNPMAGCLPMIPQIPIFFALYKVLFISIEMRQAPFFGWIHDLSAPDPTTIVNLFGLIPWTPPTFLMLGAWPIIMGCSMYVQQRLNPAPADPTQAKVFALMPVIFTIMLAQFPAGLVIYWAWNNIISMGQQWAIIRTVAAKA